jgi:ABC-2 type transport system permease protein
LSAAWLLAAVTLTLLGIAPRFTPVPWRAGRISCGVPVGFVVQGSTSGCSTWNRSRTSFRVGGGSFSPVPLLWLLAIDAALVAMGVAAFRRCGVRC